MVEPTSLKKHGILLQAAVANEFALTTNLVSSIVASLSLSAGQLVVFLTVIRSYSIKGWDNTDLGLLYGIGLTAHALSVISTVQTANIDLAIREGEVEQYLLRPAPLLSQLLLRRFSVAGIVDLLVASSVLVLALRAAGPSIALVCAVVAACVAGALVESSIAIGISAIAFRRPVTRPIRSTFDELLRLTQPFPLTVLGPVLTVALTVVVPIGLVAFVPTAIVLKQASLWPLISYCIVGVVLLSLAITVFNRASEHARVDPIN